MPELGTKYECEECGTKFYDLGRAQVICPKCEWNPEGEEEPEKAPETEDAEDAAGDEEE